MRLVVNYFTHTARLGASAHRAVWVPQHITRHVAWLVTWSVVDYFAYVARLVIDYLAHAAHPGASARRAVRRTSLHAAHRRLLLPRRVSGCLGTSRGSSRGLSSTTSPTSRVRVPQHVARLVVNHTPSRRSTSHRSVVLALTVRPIAPSRGSTTPCAATRLQPRRASRLLVSQQHRLYFEYAARHRDIVFRSHRVDHSSRLVFQTSREQLSRPQ
jgi:hypothetical protein